MKDKNPKAPSDWTDQDIEDEIARLEAAIQRWMEEKGLWYDCGFMSHLTRKKCEPDREEPVVTYFYGGQSMDELLYGDLGQEFEELLEELEYWSESDDTVTVALRSNDPELAERFADYFHWKWVCSLLVEDTSDVYEELYSHFARSPDDLHKLHWRDFEVLLFRIFQNHGYRALLGPGQGDAGIDLHLWQQSPIGDMLTVVQAKKYAPHRKIELTPVQALYGAAKADNAAQSLFITTSTYTPAAKRFAARVSQELQLAEKDEIVSWCAKASHGVIADKSSLIAFEKVERLIHELSQHPDARIVHATWGYNMTHNSYAIVIKETKHAALLLFIGLKDVSDDGFGQQGTQVPLLDASTIKHFNSNGVKRATRQVRSNGGVAYWDGELYFTPWDGKPNRFDYMD
ncbi:restriction endonuclease [Variovorax sp. RB2P76]|uniref:restriction endonuclease n=1 Tax=Variovorax sp. RB2P76 TaxID=3443736 RepID=UPI003F483AA1